MMRCVLFTVLLKWRKSVGVEPTKDRLTALP